MEANTNISGQWISDDNMFSGRWINKNTGQKITISNSIIDNNEMILMTSIGQMTMDEWSRDYIQDIDEEPAVSIKESKPTQKTNMTNNMSSQIVDDYLLPEDKALLNGTTNKNISDIPYVTITTSLNPSQTKQETKHKDILDKFFGNEESTTLKVNMNFNFDIDELKTLMKYIDLNLDDICEYIYENVVNKDAVKKQIKETIYNYLENSI